MTLNSNDLWKESCEEHMEYPHNLLQCRVPRSSLNEISMRLNDPEERDALFDDTDSRIDLYEYHEEQNRAFSFFFLEFSDSMIKVLTSSLKSTMLRCTTLMT